MTKQAKPLKSELDFTKTPADKITLKLIDFLGSGTFLTFCILAFTFWIGWNLLPLVHHFDPFPFPLLEMGVSIFAIILSVTVLINQNRQRRIESIQRDVEFEVNVRAEEEVTRLLTLVHEIHRKLGLNTAIDDHELEEMKNDTDLKAIHRAVEPKQKD
ncbi:DUF1003 domain-containing protein [Mucilaginibacter agri]|uniref:DUF1003 domain-containing protein n=1 Tax=Mucilaginibacter agri TaxID=2695265 RepID=A0A965ZCT1_9SPHI|nr:DUF1003 domain-containing protein [Mucilaginibacter agri]NCD68360.1 DUF1003 domain-containing protein [Mucilaginibacter agri]